MVKPLAFRSEVVTGQLHAAIPSDGVDWWVKQRVRHMISFSSYDVREFIPVGRVTRYPSGGGSWRINVSRRPVLTLQLSGPWFDVDNDVGHDVVAGVQQVMPSAAWSYNIPGVTPTTDYDVCVGESIEWILRYTCPGEHAKVTPWNWLIG